MTTTPKKAKKVKPVHAWAVLEFGEITLKRLHYSRRDALAMMALADRTYYTGPIRVLITPAPKRRG